MAVLGLTFKPNTDDLREAPSLVNIPLFLDDGATVKAWDPVGVENYKRHFPSELQYCDTIEETLRDAHICFIFTEWPEVKALKPDTFKELMKKQLSWMDVTATIPILSRSQGLCTTPSGVWK